MARPRKYDGVVFKRSGSQFWWIRYRDNSGTRHEEPARTTDWKEAQKKLRERLQARDDRILEIVHKGEHTTFQDWTATFLENYSQPPLRSPKTYASHQRAVTHLDAAFGARTLMELSADLIEGYLRTRLRARVRRKTRAGVVEKGVVQPSTVHQEFRVLRRVLNVAVRKRLLPSNPCWGVEFPVAVRRVVPAALRVVVGAATDRGDCAGVSQKRHPDHHRDGASGVQGTHADEEGASRPSERGGVDPGLKNRQRRGGGAVDGVGGGSLPSSRWRSREREHYLFPSDNNPLGHQTTFKTAWAATLRRAKVPYFRIYDLRSTYATRLSAGGVADEWVTQLLRQGDAKVFKKYSQMKLQMKREALQKINRVANEGGVLRQAG